MLLSHDSIFGNGHTPSDNMLSIDFHYFAIISPWKRALGHFRLLIYISSLRPYKRQSSMLYFSVFKDSRIPVKSRCRSSVREDYITNITEDTCLC